MLTKALEYTERARGHLCAVHQMAGGADQMLAGAVRMLRRAGHEGRAGLVEWEILGRRVIPGLWTDQLVEAYDCAYCRVFTAVEEHVRHDLAAGRRHLAEAELQRAARARRRKRTTLWDRVPASLSARRAGGRVPWKQGVFPGQVPQWAALGGQPGAPKSTRAASKILARHWSDVPYRPHPRSRALPRTTRMPRLVQPFKNRPCTAMSVVVRLGDLCPLEFMAWL